MHSAVGVHDGRLINVKKRKLRLYGHISRSTGLAKTVLQGTVKGARRIGRQKNNGKTTPMHGQEPGLEIRWGRRKTGKLERYWRRQCHRPSRLRDSDEKSVLFWLWAPIFVSSLGFLLALYVFYGDTLIMTMQAEKYCVFRTTSESQTDT